MSNISNMEDHQGAYNFLTQFLKSAENRHVWDCISFDEKGFLRLYIAAKVKIYNKVVDLNNYSSNNLDFINKLFHRYKQYY